MIQGIFVDNTPYIRLTLINEGVLKNEWFILDTGFSGDLHISHNLKEELGLNASLVVPMAMANGLILNLPRVGLQVSMEGRIEELQAVISKGASLAGVGFLSKFAYRAIFDGKFKTVQLVKA